jgi:hypothetical protein
MLGGKVRYLKNNILICGLEESRGEGYFDALGVMENFLSESET